MGIFQDNFSSLSELERLAAMAHDPVRVHEIGADQWPLAMMACGLMASNDEEKQEENLGIYSIFVTKTTPAARKGSLVQLSRFISARRGEGWKSLLPYALEETDSALSRRAAILIATLAQPSPSQQLAGVEEIARQLYREESDAPVTMLEAVLSLSDMRVLPILEPLLMISSDRLSDWLQELNVPANRLACTWLLNVLAAHPDLADDVAAALCRMAPLSQVIIDLALPVPTWAFEKPTPEPLHGWSRPEYFARMLPELEPVLSADLLQQVRTAWSA